MLPRFTRDRNIVVKKLTDEEVARNHELHKVSDEAYFAINTYQKELLARYGVVGNGEDILTPNKDHCEIRGQYLIIDTSNPERFGEAE